MNKVVKRLLTWLRFERREERLKRLVRESVVRSFGACPICSRRISAHRFFDLAFTGVGTVEDASALELTKARAWNTLLQFRQADMQSDLRVWRVVACPSGGMVVGIMLSPYEYLLSDQLLELNESGEVHAIGNEDWVQL